MIINGKGAYPSLGAGGIGAFSAFDTGFESEICLNFKILSNSAWPLFFCEQNAICGVTGTLFCILVMSSLGLAPSLVLY